MSARKISDTEQISGRKEHKERDQSNHASLAMVIRVVTSSYLLMLRKCDSSTWRSWASVDLVMNTRRSLK